jgi:RNA-directed DNA polymerase
MDQSANTKARNPSLNYRTGCLTIVDTFRRLSLADIARELNPLLRGWIEYYGRYTPSALYPLLRHVNLTLVRWVMRKFKRFKAQKVRAARLLEKLARTRADLFVHWRIGMIGAFA